jgi:WD40 repeat protein
VPAVGAEQGAAPLDDSGRLAAIASNGTVVIRRPSGSSAVAYPLLGADRETRVAFDGSGRTIAALDRQHRVRLFDAAGGRPQGPPVTGRIDLSPLTFTADGRIATCCGTDGDTRVRVWDRNGGGLSGPQPADDGGGTEAMAATADGPLVIGRDTGKDFTITGAGRPLRLRTGEGFEASLSPDGRWAVIPTDTTYDLWDVERRRKTTTLDTEPVFSPRGRLVAVGAAPIALVDRFTGRSVGTLGSSDSNFVAMAFSPDGRTLAALDSTDRTVGSSRASLVLWDVAAEREIGSEPLLVTDRFMSFPELTYSPDGRRLVLTTDDESPVVFDLDVDAWAKRACELAPSCR